MLTMKFFITLSKQKDLANESKLIE